MYYFNFFFYKIIKINDVDKNMEQVMVTNIKLCPFFISQFEEIIKHMYFLVDSAFLYSNYQDY